MAVLQPVHLPRITIQHDFLDVIEDIQKGTCTAEDIWISCYRISPELDHKQESVHGKVRVTLDQASRTIELEPRSGVSCQWATTEAPYQLRGLVVACSSLDIPPTHVRFPSRVLPSLHRGGVECMDVAGEWIATGAADGNLRLDRWRQSCDAMNGTRYGRGHVSDLTSVQFFPSGQVILTTATDLSARIFSVDVSSARSQPGLQLLHNPRTLAHPHTRAVTSAAIIGRGEHIVTASRDGRVRVWNVARTEVTAEASWPKAENGTYVCAMAVMVGNKVLGPNASLLLLSLSSGALHFLRLPMLDEVQGGEKEIGAAALDALALSPVDSLLAVGSSHGLVSLFKVSCESTIHLEPVVAWQRSEAAITSLAFDQLGQSVLVAATDGLPYRAEWRCQEGAQVKIDVKEEWAGFDCDAVSSARMIKDIGFAAGKDGSVKIYESSS